MLVSPTYRMGKFPIGVLLKLIWICFWSSHCQHYKMIEKFISSTSSGWLSVSLQGTGIQSRKIYVIKVIMRDSSAPPHLIPLHPPISFIMTLLYSSLEHYLPFYEFAIMFNFQVLLYRLMLGW